MATGRLWRTVAHEVRAEFPDVQYEDVLADACSMFLIRNPRAYDVIATENLFGDVLSDEASMLTGSMGMLPSASLGERLNAHGFRRGLYEPIHGTAPDIAGQGIANPLAMILSAAMMLRWSFGLNAEAARVEKAVERALNDGLRCKDIASPGAEGDRDEGDGRRSDRSADDQRAGDRASLRFRRGRAEFTQRHGGFTEIAELSHSGLL